ncbi:hypothetical protein GTY54_22555 [Streptomyces sp. SID625]|nr:hypothetical protein [Streptomyces sp. SID625]
MSRRASRHGSGGRAGQHHNATPQLRSYTRPPAGPVTVTRADGSTEVQNPLPAKKDVPKPRRKKAAASQKPPLKTPTLKQASTVPCPVCKALPGEPCSLRGGHRARFEAYRAGTARGVPASRIPVIEFKAAALQRERREQKRQPVSQEEKAKRAAQSTAAKAKGSGNPYKSPNTKAVTPDRVLAMACPRCRAAPGVHCNARDVTGRPALHQERQQAARAATWKQR